MFCPNCRAEFREGFVHCRKCAVNLVEELPPLPEESLKNQGLTKKLLSISIERWLRIGGLTLIIISVLADLVQMMQRIVQAAGIGRPEANTIALEIVTFLYAAVKDSLWGLFYVALAKIIELLKQGQRHDQ